MDEDNKVTANWTLLYASSIIVDGGEILIGILLPGIGEAINLFVNFVYGGLLAFYFHHRGISMVRGKNMTRFIASFAIDELSFGFLPAWTIDVWLTHRMVKEENAIIDQQQKESTGPLYQNGRRRPSARITPLNQNNVRLPK